MGSLGDLHPMIALGLELRRHGHDVVISSWQGYAEKIAGLGFEFRTLRPTVDQTDRELTRKVMDAKTGPETVIRGLIFPSLGDMYDDLQATCSSADLLITGELIYVAASLSEKTGIKWISTSLAPLSMFSSYDPNVYPAAQWLEIFRPLPVAFHRALFRFLRWTLRSWYGPYKEFRRGLGLSEGHDPIFNDKFSRLLHLALFSEALGKPQPDWPASTLQTGFCFYDESDTVELHEDLSAFLDAGDSPIVFTLGSAAVMDARDFFDESAKAARILGCRAILLYGQDNQPPKGLSDDIVAFESAPYSLVFPRSACVVHQGGVGTTAQVLRAGVPHLIMPYSHDQPDNAARCRRAGVAEVVGRDRFTGANAAGILSRILSRDDYRQKAKSLKQIVDSENGPRIACDAIEDILKI